MCDVHWLVSNYANVVIILPYCGVGSIITKYMPIYTLSWKITTKYLFSALFPAREKDGIGLFVEMNVSSKSSWLRHQLLTVYRIRVNKRGRNRSFYELLLVLSLFASLHCLHSPVLISIFLPPHEFYVAIWHSTKIILTVLFEVHGFPSCPVHDILKLWTCFNKSVGISFISRTPSNVVLTHSPACNALCTNYMYTLNDLFERMNAFYFLHF